MGFLTPVNIVLKLLVMGHCLFGCVVVVSKRPLMALWVCHQALVKLVDVTVSADMPPRGDVCDSGRYT